MKNENTDFSTFTEELLEGKLGFLPKFIATESGKFYYPFGYKFNQKVNIEALLYFKSEYQAIEKGYLPSKEVFKRIKTQE